MNGATELQCFYDILAAIGFIVVFGIIIATATKPFPFIKL